MSCRACNAVRNGRYCSKSQEVRRCPTVPVLFMLNEKWKALLGLIMASIFNIKTHISTINGAMSSSLQLSLKSPQGFFKTWSMTKFRIMIVRNKNDEWLEEYHKKKCLITVKKVHFTVFTIQITKLVFFVLFFNSQ